MFVVNKASREDYDMETYTAMQTTLGKLFDKSKLQMKGLFSVVEVEMCGIESLWSL